MSSQTLSTFLIHYLLHHHHLSHSYLLLFFLGDGGPALLATLDRPSDVITDPMGNIYIADTYNSKIRKVSVDTGFISTVAGMVVDGRNQS